MMNRLTYHAIHHTAHCLLGCSIGEILGSAIGTQVNWANAAQTVLAVLLAFVFGYGLTYFGGRRQGLTAREASRAALATDTVSIISMEIIDNVLEYLIPGAMNAHVSQFLFWWSLVLSLAVAFAVTIPVNRFVLARSQSEHL